jgi:uncharacterized membrane protein YfcA
MLKISGALIFLQTVVNSWAEGAASTTGFILTGLNEPGLPPGSLGYVNLPGFALIAPATVLTAPIGARIAHGFPARKLSIFFGLFLVLAAARLFYRALA